MANEAHEIETLEEFFVVTADVADLSTLSLATYTFQEVDFRPMDRSDWDALNLGGAFFLGCTFPDGVGVSSVRERGGYAVQSPPEGYLPKGLRPFRAFLYCQSEIQRMDAAAYAWYMSDEGKTAVSKMWQAAHDWSISDALGDLAEGRSCVVIMGGHQAGRSSDAYRQCVELTWRLAREGFIVVSGGGPGAMEAANLGAYLSAYDETVIDEALDILTAPVLDDNGDEIEFAHEYENTVSAERVVARFGAPTNQPSIGIPTYKYGHEPTNRFATYVAKFFSNALREDLLTTDVASCGVVYFPGSAGTRQEVFQQACANHYTEDPVPMVFLGTDFWGGDNGVVSLLRATAVGRPFADHILLTDGNDEVVDALTSFRSEGKAADLIATPRFPSEYWVRRDASRFHRFIGEHGADEDGDQTDNGSAGL